MKPSAVIITLNEEDRITACLESLSFCGEIVVVDAGSSDGTVETARRFTDRVIYHKWEGYGAQKEFAVRQAAHPWALLIDADERVTDKLRDSILALPEDPPENGFFMRRDFYFMGRRLRHGGEYPVYLLRLFRKGRFYIDSPEIHEEIRVSGTTKLISGSLNHYSFRSLTDYFQRFNRYSSLAAMERQKRGARPSSMQHFRFPFEFFLRYFVRFGFLDGYPGFVWAMLSSFYAWTKYAKLKELQDYPPKSDY